MNLHRNLVGPYPKGVENPYVTHVHPYPTRFHGAIYTRPEFDFPFVESPQSVFKPDDFSETGPDRMNGLGATYLPAKRKFRRLATNGTNGLGELQYNTGRGIFRPGGRGGGIFDGTLAGLGEEAGVTYDESRFPWKKYSADTAALQKATNVAMKELGYCAVAEDGILGPATCGARKAAHDEYESGMAVPDSCQSFTAPKSCGGGTSPVAPPPPPSPPSTDQPRWESAAATSNWMWFGVAGVAVFGALYMFGKRKK